MTKFLSASLGFGLLKTKLLGFLSVPMHSNFDEVNLRFYVRRQTGSEVRRGVVFIREMVPRRAIAFVARTFYNENYVALPMAHEVCPIASGPYSGCVPMEERRVDGAESTWKPMAILNCRWRARAFRCPSIIGDMRRSPASVRGIPRLASSRGESGGCGSGVLMAMGMSSAEKMWPAVLRGEPQSAFVAEGSPVTVMRGRRL